MRAGGSNLAEHGIYHKCDILVTTKSGEIKAHPEWPSSFDCRLPVAVSLERLISIFNWKY